MKQRILLPIFISTIVLFGTFLIQTKFSNCQTNFADNNASFFPGKKVGQEINGILVVYPSNHTEIDAASTFFIGSINEGQMLLCNGQPVNLNPHNFFAHKVNLKPGVNNFIFSKDSGNKLVMTIKRTIHSGPLPGFPPQINERSLKPGQEMSLMPGDRLELAMQASPGGSAEVTIGKNKIQLHEIQGKKQAVNRGRSTTYGIAQQTGKNFIPGTYIASYKISADDDWQGIQPIFTLTKEDKKVNVASHHKIWTWKQPISGTTVTNNTIVRIAPELARKTPLPAGVNLVIDGFTGKYWRIELCNNQHVYILKEDINTNNNTALSSDNEAIKTVNIEGNDLDERVIIPLSQKLPFQIEQHLSPNNVVLKIFGASSDTDWVMPVDSDSNKKLSAPHSQMIDYITWAQANDRLYQLTVNLKTKQQWGFWADYEDTNLVLHIKKPPRLANDTNLKGLIICLDPGHGGSETGSIGCSGICESAVNLAIAEKLKKYLQDEQATVIMTRENNDNYLGLYERVEIARKHNANLLVSIHNNALPDGRDPMAEHGSSTYWYHPQAVSLAKQLKNSLLYTLHWNDHGTLYQNLALCRPSDMLACLVEVGFMINPDEYSLLIDPGYQDKAAFALKEGIKSFLNNSLSENKKTGVSDKHE